MLIRCETVVAASLLCGCGVGAPDLLSLGDVHRNSEGEVIRLSLRGDRVTNASLGQLRELPQLHEISLQECSSVSDSGLASLSDVTALTRLDLIRVPITDRGLRYLGNAPRLAELHLGHTAVTGSGLADLGKLPLKHLSLRSHHIESGELAGLANWRSLQILELHCPRRTLDELPPLEDLPQLESLVAFQTPLGDSGLQRVRNARSLKRLVIDLAGVGNAAIDVLNTLPNLEELSLARSAVTGSGLRTLSLPRLRTLSLEGCEEVTDETLANLAGLPRLQELNLCDSAATGTDLTGLEAVPSLKKVEFTGEQFKGSDDSIKAFKQLLPECEVVVLRS